MYRLPSQGVVVRFGVGDLASQREMGPLHGDAYIGNLLREPTCRFILCDFQSTSIGPLAYGLDVTTLPSWPAVRRI